MELCHGVLRKLGKGLLCLGLGGEEGGGGKLACLEIIRGEKEEGEKEGTILTYSMLLLVYPQRYSRPPTCAAKEL